MQVRLLALDFLLRNEKADAKHSLVRRIRSFRCYDVYNLFRFFGQVLRAVLPIPTNGLSLQLLAGLVGELCLDELAVETGDIGD